MQNLAPPSSISNIMSLDTKGDDYYHMMRFFSMATANLNQTGNGEGSRMKNKTIKFPLKLMYVLECGKYASISRWSKDGKSFVINDPKAFEIHVLPSLFKTSQFESFVRKLCRWGFAKRSGTACRFGMMPTAIRFCHPAFQRGKFALCSSDVTCNSKVDTAASRTLLNLAEDEAVNESKEMLPFAVDVARRNSSSTGASMLDAAHAAARRASFPSSLLVNPSSFGQLTNMQESMPGLNDDHQHQPTILGANGSLLRAQPFTVDAARRNSSTGDVMRDAAIAATRRGSASFSLLVNPSSFGQLTNIQEPLQRSLNDDHQQHQPTVVGTNGSLLLAQQQQQHLRQQLSCSFANQQQVSSLKQQQQVLSMMPSQTQLRQMRVEDIEDRSPSFAKLYAKQDSSQGMNRNTSTGEQQQHHQNLLEMELMLQHQQQQRQEYSTNASQLSQSQFQQDMLLSELAGRRKLMEDRRNLLEQRDLPHSRNDHQSLQQQELLLLQLQRNNLSNGSPQELFQDLQRKRTNFSNVQNQNQMNNIFSASSNNA